ncbi:MAG: sugar phosphate isomerase/epimerase [Planctomycetota bacterium]|nr:sugar phosphate isomerase/epimerase [Planctomycetota bacterium]
MLHNHMTRRETLLAGAAAMLPLAAASAASAADNPQPQVAPTIGIATLGFADYTNRRLAEELAAQGIRTVQLFLSQTDSRYWKYNGRSDLSDLSAARCKEIADAYRSAGIAIHSLGVYTNLIHPDEAERKANMAYFEAMMKAAQAMGVRTLITEAGHYEPPKPEPVAYHFQEEVWKQMVATARQLAHLAERYDATVLFEPFFRGFLASAKRTRVFLEEVNSPRIRALLDPANLLEVNDLEEMFGQLTPWIDCLHAKDRKMHVDRGVPAGKGDLDYKKFVALAAKHTPKAPLILEYVGAADYKQALSHLQGAMRG